MRSLGVEQLASSAREIARRSAGLPLFILETSRHLLENGGAPRCPPRVAGVIEQRLARLSPGALELVRLAAVAGSDLTPGVAAGILGGTLTGVWAELESAHFLHGCAFTHDLLYETVRDTVPAAVRGELHGRIAETLEQQGATAGAIAQHWQAADRPARAAPWLARAAREAHARFRLEEAAALFGAAADAFEAAGQPEAALDALEAQTDALHESDVGERHQALVQRMQRLAVTASQRARAMHAHARLLNQQMQGEEAQRVAAQALALLPSGVAPKLRASLEGDVALALWHQGRLREARDAYRDLSARYAQLGDQLNHAGCLNDLALALDYLAEREAAAGAYAQAQQIYARLSRPDLHAAVLANWGGSLLQGSRSREAAEKLQASLTLQSGLLGLPNLERRTLQQLSGCLRDLGRYGEALECLRRARELAEQHGLIQGYVDASLAISLVHLGAYEAADETDQRARQALTKDADQVLIGLNEVRRLVYAGALEDAACMLSGAEQRLNQGSPATSAPRLLLWRALLSLASHSAAQARSVLEHARPLVAGVSNPGLEITLQVREAQVLLACGLPAQALDLAERAAEACQTFAPLDVTPFEAQLTRVQALEALGAPEACAARTHLQNVLLDTAAQHVPAEYRAGFLRRNPVHRAVLEGSGGWPPAILMREGG